MTDKQTVLPQIETHKPYLCQEGQRSANICGVCVLMASTPSQSFGVLLHRLMPGTSSDAHNGILAVVSSFDNVCTGSRDIGGAQVIADWYKDLRVCDSLQNSGSTAIGAL